MNTLRVLVADGDEQWADAADLVAEYAEVTAVEIGPAVAAISKGFAILRAEVAGVREVYSPPGAVLLAYVEDKPAGCVAIEALADGVFELRRLYVRPEHRGGLGRALMLAAAEHAKAGGGSEIRLDVLYTRTIAIDLYRALGYVESPRQVEPNLMLTMSLTLQPTP
ncbi:MAG: GNAT family N-acetyltransferase [Sporichthyaceae bacterium]